MSHFTEEYVVAATWSAVEALLWSTSLTDEDRAELDMDVENWDGVDIPVDDIAFAEYAAEIRGALEDCHADVLALDMPAEQFGHDFTLTRNHHGAGFWDRGYGPAGDRLTDYAHAAGPLELCFITVAGFIGWE